MSATVGKFSVEVRVGDKVVETAVKDGFRYALTPHEANYTARLINNGDTPCDGHFDVDGKRIDEYRIEARSFVDVKGTDRLFVALKVASKEGQEAGLQRGDSKLGEISCKFYPERPRPPPAPRSRDILYEHDRSIVLESLHSVDGSDEDVRRDGVETIEQSSLTFHRGSHTNDRAAAAPPQKLEAVGTGLGEKNDQSWRRVTAITDIDEPNITIVNLRLAAVPRHYAPLVARTNPMPPSLNT